MTQLINGWYLLLFSQIVFILQIQTRGIIQFGPMKLFEAAGCRPKPPCQHARDKEGDVSVPNT